MKSIVTLLVVFALAIIIIIARLWRDLGQGGPLFHWSPPGWEHDETLGGPEVTKKDLKGPLIKK